MEDMPQLPAVEYAERSDPGRDPEKQVNEDACGHRETRIGHLCVVCDGMGGHASGREAAELALATIVEVMDRATEIAPPARALRAAIEEANRRVHAMQTSEVAMGRPGATVVAVVLHAQGTEVAHVGDSRAYLVHQGQIVRLTRDHSIVQELVDRGLLAPELAPHHPEANRITRALGISAEVEPELRPEPVRHVSGDALVLCSDGLSDLVLDQEILDIVGGEPAAQAAGKLVDLANARGGHDNVTVAILRARESSAVPAGVVATTVAQTAATQTNDAPLASPTIVESPLAGAMGPPGPPATLARPLEPTPSPPPSRLASRGGPRAGPAVTVGLALSGLAAALLVGVLMSHFDERSGKRNPSTEPAVFAIPLSDAAADSFTTLAPESVAPVAAPAPSEPTDPIAPLDTSPAPAPRRHRY
jgi:PPM family protein phosphatase